MAKKKKKRKKATKKKAKRKATKKKAKRKTKKKAKRKATKKKAKRKTKKKAKRKATKKKAKRRPKKKAKKKKKKSKRKPNKAFMKPLKPSPALAKVVGSKSLPRTQVVKKLWQYIKRKKLQDKKNRRMIVADATLKPIFRGKKKVSMFEMTKLVSKHLK